METKASHILGATFFFFLLLIINGCSRILPLASKTHPNHREEIFEEAAEILRPQNSLDLHQHDENNTFSETMEISNPEPSLNVLESYPQTIDQPLTRQARTEIHASSSLISGDQSSSSLLSPMEGIKGMESTNFSLMEKFQPDQRQETLDAALQLCQDAQKEWEGGNPDDAIESLDRAYEFMVYVGPDDDVDLLQQKDDLRFLISKRIVEIYASRQNVVNGNHNEIPLIMNEHVKKEIKYFLGGERKCFLEAYKRSGLYLPMILKELREAGLPDKLCWLPLIESRFKEKALSRARALGLWQFIPSTGYKFGLKRDKWVDERMDSQKSTRAAIEYLTQLHKIFGDWTTALAAYNCGEGKVLRVIRKQHLNYLDNFWDLYERLPLETARYVPLFLAALHIIENPDQFGIKLGEPLPPLEYEEISLNKQIHLKTLADKLKIKEKDLTLLNPELRYQVIPNYEYKLKIPPNIREQVLACVESIPEWVPVEREYITVRIKRGETISHLAKQYKVSVSSIMRANRIRKANRVRAGQKLRIPLKQRVYASTKKTPSTRVKIYRIKRGDCPFTIAKNYNMKLSVFLTLNGLNIKSLVYPGQRVLVRRD